MNKKLSVLAVLAAGFSISLAACGGGGSSSPASSPVTASSPSGASAPAGASSSTGSSGSAPLATSATNPFPTSSGQAAIFTALNSYRSQLGVGVLQDDPILDTSAMAHATYLEANLANGNLAGALSHDEVSTFSDFYAETPLARAQRAGAPPTEWVGEDITVSALTDASQAGSDCVSGLLDTVYHLSSLTSTQQTLGVGFTPVTNGVSSVCVTDFGSTTGVYGTPEANAIPVFGGQQMATTTVAHVPLAGETGVATAMTAESPNPVPSITSPGRPLMLRVNAENAGDVLTVSSFTLTDASGNAVAGEILIPAGAASGSTSAALTDPNGLLPPGVAFFVPSQPLSPNTAYSAAFNGARDGTPISSAWTFTTGTN